MVPECCGSSLEIFRTKCHIYLAETQVSNNQRMQASLSVWLVWRAQPVFYLLQTYVSINLWQKGWIPEQTEEVLNIWCSKSVNKCTSTLLPLVDTQDITTVFHRCRLRLRVAPSKSQMGDIITATHQPAIGQDSTMDPSKCCHWSGGRFKWLFL